MCALISKGWWIVLLVFFAASGFFLSRAGDLKVNADVEVLFDNVDPSLEKFMENQEVWGADEYAIFCATADEWFTAEGLQRAQAIQDDLTNKVRHCRLVASLGDIPLLRQKDNPSIFGLMGGLKTPFSEGIDIERAKVEVLDHEMAKDNFISSDGRNLSYLVFLNDKNADKTAVIGDDELTLRRQEMVEDLRAITAEWSGKMEDDPRISGFPVILTNLIEHVRHDLRVFTIASALLFFFALLMVYRSLAYVVAALVTCAIPVICVVGTMVVKGMTLTIITSNLPLLLFVLMLPYTIYVIERFRERRADVGNDEPVSFSLASAVRSVFVPCLFSALTTIAGFIALSQSPIPPVETFGMMMAIGMAVGLAIVLLFLPCFLRLFGNRIAAPEKSGDAAWMRGLVRIFENACIRHRVAVLVLSAAVFVICLVGAMRITVEQKFTHYFWESSEAYQGLEYIDQRLGGLMPLEVVMTADDASYWTEDKGQAALEAVEEFFRPLSGTGNLSSLRSVRDEARKAFPAMPVHQIIALIRTASPEFLQQYLTKDGKTARITARMKETDPTLKRLELLEELDAHLAGKPELAEVNVEVTGAFVLYAQVLRTLVDSQRESFLLVLGAILLMLFILFRSPVLPFVVMLPQVLPSVAILGIMGWAGIPLDLVTVMIASIAMGVGVDAAIQYTMRYRIELLATGGDREEALRRSHRTIGRAIWISTSVIVVGFCVLVLSDFFPSVWFGVFTGIAMLMSQFAALTTLPSLFLVTGYPKK
ncbi:MAG: putative RND superfamily exporter protein [Verrucomicrobiales bacterium]|jgi:predicted RND superfamily exporter protein